MTTRPSCKKCPECGSVFLGYLIYCSAECSDAAAKRMGSKGNPIDGFDLK